MIHGRPETAVQTDTTGSFHIVQVRQFYLIHFVTRGAESNFPRTRDNCSIIDISHPDYDGVEFYAWDGKRVATMPTKATAPFVLKVVSLIPKSK